MKGGESSDCRSQAAFSRPSREPTSTSGPWRESRPWPRPAPRTDRLRTSRSWCSLFGTSTRGWFSMGDSRAKAERARPRGLDPPFRSLFRTHQAQRPCDPRRKSTRLRRPTPQPLLRSSVRQLRHPRSVGFTPARTAIRHSRLQPRLAVSSDSHQSLSKSAMVTIFSSTRSTLEAVRKTQLRLSAMGLKSPSHRAWRRRETSSSWTYSRQSGVLSERATDSTERVIRLPALKKACQLATALSK